MRKSNCRTCNAPIVWLKTQDGKNMPTDAETVDPGDGKWDNEKHTSHFATCPQANEHRKPR